MKIEVNVNGVLTTVWESVQVICTGCNQPFIDGKGHETYLCYSCTLEKNKPVRYKCSDIDTIQLLWYVWINPESPGFNWCMIWDIWKQFEDFPSKLVSAKLYKLVRKGVLDGCCCGCRGDFELTDKGKALLKEAGMLV